eukprot:CAMPEP_0197918652 /NCGR_PEP_ID=MMETSP1439-20131203/85852_1 /TAXON_ID=66791 /ORGANISM="Gonyaulax spinifera, Strain CCMP409" /LENGTH=502 /DNA_ID=CAMNT_0043540775 /DNA_START=9 /DNA_END=1515 /DNA_ORIENTATION=+
MASVGGHPAAMQRRSGLGLARSWVLAALVAMVSGKEVTYTKGLLTVPRGGDEEVTRFVNQNMEPRHAVAIVIAGKGTKRHRLLEELAEDDSLNHLLAMGIQFGRGPSSLVVHRYRYPVETYGGKWIRSAIHAWLQDVAYPPVNQMQFQFAPPKYLTQSPFGTVLVVKQVAEQTEALVQALEPFAKKYRERFKFSFFTRAPGTQRLCDLYGIRTNDELILFEKPREEQSAEGKHSHVPNPAKYRLDEVSPERIESFFEGYDSGTWPRYFKSAGPRSAPVVTHGIRELTGWDFYETTKDPKSSVFVAFVSASCSACEEFEGAFKEVATRVQEARQKEGSIFSHLVIARIDQSKNEHSELIKGTPWLRYWPRGEHKRSLEVELRSVESIWDYLEERAVEEADGAMASEGTCTAGSGSRAGCKDAGPQKLAAGARSGTPGDSPEPAAGARIVLGKPEPGSSKGYLSTESDLEDEAEAAQAASFAPHRQQGLRGHGAQGLPGRFAAD